MGSISRLGHIIWWTIPSERRSLHSLRHAMTNLGFNPDLVEVESPRAAFANANRDVANANKAEAKLIEDSPNKTVYGLVDLNVDRQAASITAVHHTTTVLLKGGGEFGTTEFASTGRIGDQVHETFKVYTETVPDTKIRQMVLALIRQNRGVSLRPTGGVYLIPECNSAFVNNLNRLFADAGIGELYYAQVPDGDIERRSMAKSVVNDLIARLDLLEKEVEVVTSRVSTLHKKRDRVNEIEDLIDIYDQLLQEEGITESVKAKYNSLQEKIAAKIMEING